MLLVAAAVMARPAMRRADTDEDKAKADYFFLEALRAKSQDKPDAAFELLKRARELNPADLEIGQELALYMLMLSATDSTCLAEAMNMTKAYWDANQSDFTAGLRYGLLNDRMLNRQEALRVWNTLHELYPEKTDLTLHLADVLGQGGPNSDRNRAIALYDSIEIVEGPGLPLVGKKIELYLNENDTAGVLREADRLRLSAPANIDYQVFSGEVYSMMGRSDEALDFFNRAIELDPASGYARFSRAQYFKERGDSVAYDREVFVALRQPDLDVDTKLMILRGYISDIYADSTQQPRIRSLFDTLMVVHPLEHDIHDLYARYLITVKDYAGAAEQTEQTLGLDPADPEGWEMLASLYLQEEELDKAKDAIKRSLHYYPDNPSQHMMLGSIFYQEEEYDKAMSEYERSVELLDENDTDNLSRVYGLMGDALYADHMADSAFVYYQKAVLYDPTNYLAMNNSAYFMACEGKDLDKALEMIEKVVAVDPSSATSLDTYAWVLFKRKEYEKAREIMDRVLTLDGDDPTAEVLDHAGDIYFMDGEPRQALDFWKQALELEPDDERLREKVKQKCIIK